MKTKVEKDLIGLNERLANLSKLGTPYKNYVNKEIPMLENLVELYKKSDGVTKKKILDCIFSENSFLKKVRVATSPFQNLCQFYSWLLKSCKVLKRKWRSKLTSSPLWLPLLTKDAAIIR